MDDRGDPMLLTRRALLRASVGLASVALTACGSNPEEIPPHHGSTGASHADGRILFAKSLTIENGGKDDGIWIVENAGKPRKLLGKADGDYALQFPRWSPDGKQIAYARYGDRGIYADLWILNAVTGENRKITDFQSKITHADNADREGAYVKDSAIVAGLSWSAGGNVITFVCDKNYPALRPWSLDNPDDPASAHVITATQYFSPPNSQINFHIDTTALAPDGSAMAFVAFWAQPDNYANRQTQISLLDFGTKKYRQLTEMPGGAFDPAFSPDGQYIAFASRPGDRTNELFVMTREGKNQTQITTTGLARAPVWSPGGTKLAFLGGFEGAQFNIYVMDVSAAAPGTALSAANFGKPTKITDEQGIDARSGLTWSQV